MMLTRFFVTGLLAFSSGTAFAKQELLRCERHRSRAINVVIDLDSGTASTNRAGWRVEVLANGWMLTQPNRSFTITKNKIYAYDGHYVGGEPYNQWYTCEPY